MISLRRNVWGLFVLLIVPVITHAQLLTGLERPLDVAMSPQYPAAGEEVTLGVSSYGINLDRSAIIWYADGKEIARNTTEVKITAGTLGSIINVTVVAEEPDGLIGSGSARIRPTEVDLIWSSDSYAPPYFKGKRLAGSSARIRAEAVVRFVRPDGTAIPSSDIIYTWNRGTTRILSGRDRSWVEFAGPSLFSSEEVSIDAQSVDGAYLGRASIRIAGVDPTIELYENHPLFGVLYHRALTGSVATAEKEQRVTAVPYFARISSPNDATLSYRWNVAGLAVKPDSTEPQTITITTNGYAGPARIQLDLTSMDDLFLKARGNWELVFSESVLFSGGDSNDPFARPE
jgi:hypothetical protein